MGFVVLLWGEVFDAFASLLPKKGWVGGLRAIPAGAPSAPERRFSLGIFLHVYILSPMLDNYLLVPMRQLVLYV